MRYALTEHHTSLGGLLALGNSTAPERFCPISRVAAEAAKLRHRLPGRLRHPQITPSIRGRAPGGAALAGNTWAGSPWRAAGLIAAGEASITLRSSTRVARTSQPEAWQR